MFTYSKEKELHEYIVEHFNNYFDFHYISSEFIVKGGRVDILGKNDNTIYIVELKRDYITNSTISQLANYIPEIQKLNPDKNIVGIAVAPKLDGKINVDSLPHNIKVKTINDVNFIEPEQHIKKKRVTFTIEESLIDELKQLSEKTSIPQARIVEAAIKDKINELEKTTK